MGGRAPLQRQKKGSKGRWDGGFVEPLNPVMMPSLGDWDPPASVAMATALPYPLQLCVSSAGLPTLRF